MTSFLIRVILVELGALLERKKSIVSQHVLLSYKFTYCNSNTNLNVKVSKWPSGKPQNNDLKSQ